MNIEVVATSGCFDVLTPSHVDFLRRARSMGDMLVVLLNSDESASRRLVNSMRHRIMVLRELRCVDLVIPFNEDTPVEALNSLRPEWYVKGSDYAEESIPEAEILRLWGGHMVFLPIMQTTENPTPGVPPSDPQARGNSR